MGSSDYVRRDLALKNLIQPLAGEYGMHNNQPQRECMSMRVGLWHAQLGHRDVFGFFNTACLATHVCPQPPCMQAWRHALPLPCASFIACQHTLTLTLRLLHCMHALTLLLSSC
jgi:hypothetical protein